MSFELNATKALAGVGSRQYPGQPLGILFLWDLPPPSRLITPKPVLCKACNDTRNYNTNSAQGIYMPAWATIYDRVWTGAEEGEEERLIMLAKVISSMGEMRL